MNKEIQSSILRACARFINNQIYPIERRLEAAETRAMTPGPKGDAGLCGKDGIDGKSISADELMPVVREEISMAIKSIELPVSEPSFDAEQFFKTLTKALNETAPAA